MNKYLKRLLLGSVCVAAVLPAHGGRIGIRCTYVDDYPEFANSANYSQFPTARQHMDFGYSLSEKQHFNAQFTLPEYYIPWNHNQMDTNPHTNPLVQWILTYGGSNGNDLYGLKISREFELVPWSPPGPFSQDPRILYVSDVTAIRQVLTAAKNAGILARDNYKLYNMVTDPKFFKNNSMARDTIKLMDGVCYEVHHFNNHWPLNTGRSKPADVVDGALWTLNNFNVHGKRLEYVLYYGPFLGVNCQEIPSGTEDPFRTYLNAYWGAGLPRNHPHLIYSINAFKHSCGSDRPGLTEENPYSIAGCLKWLISKVKNVNPSGAVKYMRKRNALDYAIDGDNGAVNDQNVHMFRLMPQNINQQWHEISRGNGFYTYKKRGTNHVLDGGGGGANNQNVKLWNQNPTNINQHWKRIHMGGGYNRLEKRDTDHSIDGGVGGSDFSNVKLWGSDNNNWNQHWLID